MATIHTGISQPFSTSNPYIKYKIEIRENSISIPENISNVTVNVYAYRTNKGYETSGDGVCTCSINGTTYKQTITKSQKISFESNTIIFSKNVNVMHNADGTKTLTVFAGANHDEFNSDLNQFDMSLETIQRYGIIESVSDFDDEILPLSFIYYNPMGTMLESLQVCIMRVDNSAVVVPYRDIPKIGKAGSSYTFTFTDLEMINLRRLVTTGTVKDFYVCLKSELNGNTFLSKKITTFSLVEAYPIATGRSYKDNNSNTVAITTDNQFIIQNQSQLVFNFSSIRAKKLATLVKLEISINYTTKSMNLTGSSQSNVVFTFGKIDTTKNAKAEIVITDSRGLKTRYEMNIKVYAWSKPTAIVSATRQYNYYNQTTVFADANYSKLGNHNTISITWAYKLTTASSWTSGGSLADGGSSVVDLDNTKEWNVKITVVDRLATTIYNLVVARGMPIFYVDRNLNSVGVNALPDEANELAVFEKMALINDNQKSVGKFERYTRQSGYKTGALRITDEDQNVLTEVTSQYRYSNNSHYGEINLTNSEDASYWNATLSDSALRFRSKGNTMSLIGGDETGGSIQVMDSNSDTRIELLNDGTLVTHPAGQAYTNNIKLDSSNGKVTCVSLTQTSSRKAKENIKELSLEEAQKILQLVAVSFDFIRKSEGEDQRGFIAEDVAEIIPQLVTKETENAPASLNYIQMIPYLQTVIKDQEERIKALEEKIKKLEG